MNRLIVLIFDSYLFYGELNLKGELKPVKGVLNLSLFAKEKKFKGVVVPHKNGNEISLN